MTLNRDKLNKAIIITGTVLLVAVFSNLVATVNTALDSFNGTTCVVSAFAG
ncbi:MAG: hypothetical protein AB1782_10710 [Cyanobacteriota bacterium]